MYNTGDCWAGFYCLVAATVPNNPVVDSTGGPCPTGHFCPNGTSWPLGCTAGTYNPNTGEDACFNCPAGYYCIENSTDYSGSVCPMGHYCPLGTGSMYQYPCDKGYYNGLTGNLFYYNGLTGNSFYYNGLTGNSFYYNGLTGKSFYYNGLTGN